MLALILILNATGGTGSVSPSRTTSADTLAHRHGATTCIIKLPKAIDFAGETVPLNLPDVAERLDRELHVNAYWHSSTIQILKLAHRWFPLIEKTLAEHEVPDDMKYVCVAESGLRNVVSPAGATGFWQFLSATGKQYGLEINTEVDERYDVAKSTTAACKYLKEAYLRCGNNWGLAAASYNAGMGAITSDMETQKVNSYYDLHLKDETSRYLFRAMAFKLIITDPGKYGFCYDEEDLYQSLETKSITVKETIPDLKAFAAEHHTNLKTLKYHNPWLRGNALTVKEKTYEIALPD